MLSLSRMGLTRFLTTSAPVGKKAVQYLGQPTFQSHPHLIASEQELVMGITRAEFAQRRKALSETFPGQSLVFVAAAARRSSHDTELKFIQDSTFSYLFGFHEPGAVAVLKDDGKFFLFCRKADPEREQWDGPRCGFHRAARAFDAEDAFSLDAIDIELGKIVGARACIVSRDDLFRHHIDLDLLCRVEKVLRTIDNSDDPEKKKLSRQVLEVCDGLRLVKSDSELKLMRFAGDVSSFGHLVGMMRAPECSTERRLQSEVEHGFMELGGDGTFFNSIVAGGGRACTLHYTANDATLERSELVLVDAGARLLGSSYGGDITRTYPVNGIFNDVQREVYDMVLDVQSVVIQSVKAGTTLSHLQSIAIETFGHHLDTILGKVESEQERIQRTRRYFPHGVSHFLGLDVHDTPTVKKDRPLPINAVITVEPGLYFPVTDETIPTRFRGIGIRIEDNVVVGGDSAEIITRRYAPVDPKAIQG